jgi:cytochrome c553
MRERIAIWVAFLAVCLAVFASAMFAWRHNVPIVYRAPVASIEPNSAAAPTVSQTTASPARSSVYEARDCGTCHSIQGVGNPRYPLDGVGSRLNRGELREAITGAGASSTNLSRAVRQRKARYAQIPEEEMTELVDFLSSLVEKDK